MKLKICLIATTALCASSSAFATDLPQVRSPIDYVETCDAQGAGYFKIPGSSTCLKLGGYVRTLFTSQNFLEDYGVTKAATLTEEEERNDYSYYTRFLMHLTTMTETELASIKTYAEFYTTWENTGDNDWSTGILYSNIDFGGLALHLGYDQSLFAPFVGYTGHYNSLPVGYVETWQARATLDLGNSAAIAFGVESAEYAGGTTGGLDFTGALTFDLEPLSLGTMAIAHAYDENNYGYGVTGYVTLKPTDRLSFGVGGTYGLNTLDYLTYTYDDGISNGDLSGWNVFGGVEYKLTDNITTAVDAGYTALEVEGEAYDIMGVNGNLTFEPVSGLVFMAEGGYLTDSRDNDSLNVVGRVQYSF